MNRSLSILFVFFFVHQAMVAQVYMCKDGHTNFASVAPLEHIEAHTDRTSGAIDCANKNVAFSVDVSSFDGFNSAMQKEHFHENYLETDKYPKATFKGKIIEDINFSKKGVTTVRAKGIFTIHGVEKEKIVNVKVSVKDKEICIEASFEIPLEDHNIKVPKVVNQKIAAVIMVDVKANLKPKV